MEYFESEDDPIVFNPGSEEDTTFQHLLLNGLVHAWLTINFKYYPVNCFYYYCYIQL